jgi:hypothetical protein
MKKILLSALSVLCLTGAVAAAATPEQIEYNDMVSWLILSYYNSDKDAAYKMLNGIQDKIKAEFPMDQKIVEAVNAIRAQSQTAQEELAKKYGFADYKAFYMDLKYYPEKYKNAQDVWAEINQVGKQYSDAENALTKAYYDEFYKRVQAAEIEAIKRLQENAKAMK